MLQRRKTLEKVREQQRPARDRSERVRPSSTDDSSRRARAQARTGLGA